MGGSPGNRGSARRTASPRGATGAVGARAVREVGTRAKVQGIADGIPARAVEAKVVHTQWISCGVTRAKIGAATMG